MLREMQMSFTKRIYEYAVAYLQRTLERTRTEGVGDCWLLTIMAGFEVKDRELVRKLNAEQRESMCTSRRRAIVERAASSKKNGSFRFLCELCGFEVDFKDADSVKKAEGTHRRGHGIHRPCSWRPRPSQTVACRRLFLAQK